jgi:hypothetical protein
MILTPGVHFPGRVFTFKPSRGKILRGEQVDGLPDVPVDGGDPEPGGQPGIGVAVAKVSQDQQRLPARVQPPPPAAELLPVHTQQLGQVGQGGGGQRNAEAG